MLGIRKHRGTQVDLNQGDLVRFACDVRVKDTGVPLWKGGMHGEADVLTALVKAALEDASVRGARHVAFPALAVGSGYPLVAAAAVSFAAVRSFLDARGTLPGAASGAAGVRRITFVLGSTEHHEVFRQALEAAFPEPEAPHPGVKQARGTLGDA